MELKFKLTFKQGVQDVAVIIGVRDVKGSEITLAELDRIPEVEAFIEKLTGLRLHIDQVL